ncbi:MAG: Tetratricopeptide repeat, partial [Armatimonadetes bacterium]|nr:Tetratricopeptide repeat [Armatimonadota bacterium]
DQAAVLLDKGKFPEAAALLQQATELTPDDWAMWDSAGWAHLDSGKPELALKAFEAARKASPPGSPVNGGLVVVQFALGKPDEVLRLAKEIVPAEKLPAVSAIVRKGLEAKQFSQEWNFALGYLYSSVLRNSARALGLIESVAKADPKRAEAWLLLVEINRDLDQGPQEDAAAVKYLELAPDTPDAFRLRAERLVSLRQYAGAIAEYQAGIAKAPAADELYFQLARVHERLGQVKEVEAVYAKLIAAAEAGKREDARQQARAALASFQLRQRNYPEAEKYYREAAQRPDATVSTWETWGAVLALTGTGDEAAPAMEGAAQRDEKLRGTTDAGVRDALLAARYRAAVCRVAAGQRDQAKTGLEAALAVHNDVRTGPELEAAAFLTWLTLKEPETSKLAYQKSDERWAAFSWRRTQVDAGSGEREVKGRFNPTATAWRAILQQVQKLNPNAWPADYALARIYAAAGFNQEGLELLQKAAGRKTDWWALQFPMGQYYAQQRDKDNGVDVLRRTLRMAPECRQARVYLSLLTNLKDEEDVEPEPEGKE